MMVTMRITVLCDMTPCSLVERHQDTSDCGTFVWLGEKENDKFRIELHEIRLYLYRYKVRQAYLLLIWTPNVKFIRD